MSQSLKGRALNGIIWSCIDRFSVQGVQFLLMLILARLLSPSDYGMMGMLTLFLAISQAFIDGGFANALIRKQDRSEIDFSTVFYFNIFIGFISSLFLYLLAPFIAIFYEMPQLEPVTRVVSVVLFLKSFTVVPLSKLTISLDFKTQTKASLISVIISGILSISLAYMGWGVWALVFQILSSTIVLVILLLIFTRWKPLFSFSRTSFRNLFSYGSKILASSLIDVIYKNIYPVIIGKRFDAASLGYYTRADQFAQLPSANLTGIIQRVTFPLFSQIQDDNVKLRVVYLRILRLSAYIIFPLMMGLSALSSPIVLLLLTDKWVSVVLLLKILCFSQMWYPVHAINLNILQVKGHSDIFLKLEILKKILGIFLLLITVPLGLIAMCIGSVISSLISLVLNTYYTGKFLDLGFLKQMEVLLPAVLCSISMGGLVYLMTFCFYSHIVQLLIGFIVGIIYYIGISYITKSKDLSEILFLIKSKLKKQ